MKKTKREILLESLLREWYDRRDKIETCDVEDCLVCKEVNDIIRRTKEALSGN